MAASRVQWQIRYSGRVQGVGFRYFVAETARRLPVTGYVKNRSDGSVELVAVGVESVLRQLHQLILRSAPGHIDQSDQRSEIVDDSQFESFEIRY